MTDAPGVVPEARGLLRLDALYEVMLAALLAAAAAARFQGGVGLPAALTPPVLTAAAVVLLVAAGAIETLRRRGPRRRAVTALAAANGLTAAALLTWVLVDPGFSPLIALLAGLAAVDLALLAAFQARAVLLRRARAAGGRERSPGGRRGQR